MTDVLQLLRTGLLSGARVATAGPARDDVVGALTALGAAVRPLDADLADEQAAEAAARDAAPVDALVVDAAALFRSADPRAGELAPLRAAADLSWSAARATATSAWIGTRGGRLVLLAPAPGAGRHAEAARSALENLARTLSIEWSRHDIRITTVTPGDRTAGSEVAAVVAYLVSCAGDYFSGCRLDLS